MKTLHSLIIAGAIAASGFFYPLNADPNGLSPIGPVQNVSDAQASAFQIFKTSTINPFISSNTINGVYSPSSSLAGNIQLSVDSYARAYYLSSDAAFSNTIAWDRNANNQVNGGIDATIFQNAHTLSNGAYVDLGLLSPGALSLTLLSDGANKAIVDAGHLFFTDPNANPDGTAHAKITLFHGPNSDFYLIAWEDLNKFTDPTYDADYNDLLMVVEVIPVPEPATYALLGSLLAGVYYFKRQRVQAA